MAPPLPHTLKAIGQKSFLAQCNLASVLREEGDTHHSVARSVLFPLLRKTKVTKVTRDVFLYIVTSQCNCDGDGIC